MPYFWPSRGLQVRGLIKNLSGTYRTEYTFNQVRALEYEATSFEHAGPMRQDPDHIRRAINITGPKGRRQLQCAMTIPGYNDTSAQSQPCRNAGSRNEGGSVRPAGKGNAL